MFTSSTTRAFLILGLLIGLIYSNSLTASWHLDDEPNILTNQKLHLTALTSHSLFAALTARPGQPEKTRLYRPVPCLTLALNWYWSQNNTRSYHLVNIGIHIITSFFLFLTILQLLQLATQDKIHSSKNHFIALLATSLWAAAPIHTQAVTYIVQRMASMAAMFYLIGIYAYLKGRQKENHAIKVSYYILCLCCYLFALGSKENTIIFPFSLLLIEITFLQKSSLIKYCNLRHIIYVSLAGLAGLFSIYFFSSSNPFSFLSGFDYRSFSLKERILTEPRIILHYFEQIFFPIAKNLSIEHSVQLSTSLFHPWITLPAIIILFSLIVISVYWLRKYPLLTFPILFYFLNQIVESSIIPLELVFEHRNYLPSFFLFLPISYLWAKIIYDPKKHTRLLTGTLIVASISYLMLSGFATYSRNKVWATEGTLWTDALHKAPASARATHNLGRWYRKLGNYSLALNLFQRSYKNADTSPTPEQTYLSSLNGMASIYYIVGKKQTAIDLFEKCLRKKASNEACLKNITLTWTLEGNYEKAFTYAELLNEKYKNNPEYLYTKGFIALMLGKYALARTVLQKAMVFLPNDKKITFAMGIALKKLHAYPNALFFFHRTIKLDPKNLDYYLQLLDTYLLEQKTEQAKHLAKKILRTFPLTQLTDKIIRIDKMHSQLLTTRRISPVLFHEAAVQVKIVPSLEPSL